MLLDVKGGEREEKGRRRSDVWIMKSLYIPSC